MSIMIDLIGSVMLGAFVILMGIRLNAWLAFQLVVVYYNEVVFQFVYFRSSASQV